MKYSIMLVDDAIDKLKSHIEYLHANDIEVYQVNKITDVLEISIEKIYSFDCIILDVKMIYAKEQNGGLFYAKKLIDEIKYSKPIIFFTVLSKDNDEVILNVMKTPNVHYLQKGVTVSKLFEVLNQILNMNNKTEEF